MSYIKAKVLLPALAVAVAGIMMFGISNASAACGGSQVCAWTGNGFTGSEIFLACYPGSIPFSFPEARSLKNHCSIGQEFGWAEGGSTNWKFCMSPGGERPEPGRVNVERKC